MSISTLLFDLDDTVYPSYSGLWNAIRSRMSVYMNERLGIPWKTIPNIRQNYLEAYGTTLRGLQHNFKVDADDYLAYVHDLPLEEYLSPDPHLRELLLSLPQRRWIFTNADIAHAERVLRVLRMLDCFEGIIDVRRLDFICKPDKEAYLRALDILQEDQPDQCILFDDSVRNLAPAHELGFFTILVGQDEIHPGVDMSIQKLHELPNAMPELWAEAKKNY